MNFCEAVGVDAAARASLAGDALAAAVAARIASRTAAEWESAFAGIDACVSVVRTLREAAGSATGARGDVVAGEARLPALSVPIAATLCRSAARAPSPRWVNPGSSMAEPATTFRGTAIVTGANAVVEGEAMACDVNLAFSLVDPRTGFVKQPGHPWFDRSVAGKVLLYPSGQGSAAGSWWLLNLANEGCAPAAILNAQSDAVVIAGAVLADIPLVHRLVPDPFTRLHDGDRVRVDTQRGLVEILREAKAARP